VSTTDASLDWSEANQALLVAEFARLEALLAGESAAAAQRHIDDCRATLPAPPAIDRLQSLFELSAFERDLLLLCAGVEMDDQIGQLCAQGGRGPWASFGMALAILPQAHWSALTPVRPLRRRRLVALDSRDGLVGARLRIDERVLHYLAGINYLDTSLQAVLRQHPPAQAMSDVHREAVDSMVGALHGAWARQPLFLLHGDDTDAQGDIAAACAAELGLVLHSIRAEDAPTAAGELEALVLLWHREAALLGSALLIEAPLAEHARPAIRLAQSLEGLCFIASRDRLAADRQVVAVRVDKPDAKAQRKLWREALGPSVTRLNGALNAVATQFRFSASRIQRESTQLREAIAKAEAPDDLLWRTCRELARNDLDDLAQRISPVAGWRALILPDAQLSMLRQIATQVRQRLKVYRDWGFATQGNRGLGIAALFAGDSGTGKTLAAEVLANELHLDLYRIDLASVVSKYIGETEKNLKRVFDAGEDSGAILLFDEADALFGKRSDVRDAHDRYANIEVSYLLQRMEAYSGLAILTTNHETALDTAFQRRLRFIVHFPFPDQAQRERIWRGVFPAQLPRQAIDYAKLARLSVAGGTIRNIALNAAFLAAEQEEPLGMTQLLSSAHLEAAKRGKPYSDAETRGWT
jgi:hypothetical protein